MQYSKESLDRQKKIKDLKEAGYICFDYKFNSKNSIKNFKEKQGISIAGRLIEFELNKKTGLILDFSGKLRFKLSNNYEDKFLFKNLCLGDIIGLQGKFNNDKIFIVEKVNILTKTYIPIEKDNGECKYKFKHLSFIKEKNLSNVIYKRALVLKLIRKILNNFDFIEIDTPILHPYQGDSTAKPLFTNITSYNINFALASSPELYLKKMLVSGFNRVFSISKVFRDEKIDSTHLFEFTTVEYYMAYVDYIYMMNFTEKLLKNIAKKIIGKDKIKFNGIDLDFSKKWARISMYNELNKKFGFDLYLASNKKLLKIAKENNIIYSGKVSNGTIIIDIFEKIFLKKLLQPVFVYDFPKDASVMCYDITMAKEKKKNPNILERFELYIAGIEIANCYSELNEAEKQKEYFDNFLKGTGRDLKIDETFYHALKTGMPPASGVGFGIDRLLMILMNIKNINDVIPFSTYYENK